MVQAPEVQLRLVERHDRLAVLSAVRVDNPRLGVGKVAFGCSVLLLSGLEPVEYLDIDRPAKLFESRPRLYKARYHQLLRDDRADLEHPLLASCLNLEDVRLGETVLKAQVHEVPRDLVLKTLE